MMPSSSVVAVYTLLIATPLYGQSSGKPAELPKHFAGKAQSANLTAARTVALAVSDRSPSDPDKPEELARFRRKLAAAAQKTPLRVVSPDARPDLLLELVDAPHVRWGMYHYQNDFYAFLLLRERATGRLLYCGYQRAKFLRSASSGMLQEFVNATHGRVVEVAVLDSCADMAGRPR
ncbi:hypothetical protein [Terriglobus sp.]|uniref:hypothetical protein n=1 Tax=Terriglobus sp. TaxID=1889013 RepID=UPI003B009C7E